MTTLATTVGPRTRFDLVALLARLILGGMFLWMGLAKTGATRMALEAAGWVDHPSVKWMVSHGVVELADPIDFMKLVREYQMIPERTPWLLNLVAAVLPWAEVLCGLLLIFGVAVRGTALMLLIMLIGFTVVVTLRAWHIMESTGQPFCTIKFDCGCGAGEEWICHKIPKNLVLCLLAVVAMFSRGRHCLCHKLVSVDSTLASSASSEPRT